MDTVIKVTPESTGDRHKDENPAQVFIRNNTTAMIIFMQTSVKRWLRMSIMLAVLTLAATSSVGSDGHGGKVALQDKKILILHSYSIDYAWTRSVNEGIDTVLAGLDQTNVVRYEFLDTKNIHTEAYYLLMDNLLRNKYQNVHFDGIISVDNNALNFLEKFGRDVFPNVPVVSTGINNAGSVAFPSIADSIIAEEADHQRTLQNAFLLRPNAQNCYVVSDRSTTGKMIQLEVKELVRALNTNVRFHFVDTLSYDTIKTFAESVEGQDFIYLLPFFRGAKGNTFDQGYVATVLASHARVPVFVSWEFQLNTGVAGGSVVSGRKYGEMAANLMLAKISGREVPRAVRYRDDLSITVYDWNVLKRFEMDAGKLSGDIRYLNRPVPFFTRHKAVITPLLTIIFILSAFVLLLLKNLGNQKEINTRKNQVIALNKEVIETQRELVTTLGEVIETRSKETGHHVKRVAKVSRLIGEKIDLSQQELEVLEAASPLHDVGKIGIPDTILQHPGKLDQKALTIIREHTTIGRDLLKYSDRELLSSACTIAYQHHERWDGTGYPNGLKGDEINIFARITMLADVYDALSMDRAYKKAWPEEKVLQYILQEKARFFDPNLVEIFIENYEEIRTIRMTYSAGDS